ncbi:hypothetical protein ACYZTL_06635 [Pseudomonas sp. LB3P81]
MSQGFAALQGLVVGGIATYYGEQALAHGELPEAAKAWAVFALSMIAPALIVIGAIRNLLDGTSTLPSLLGRVCMASITVGAAILAHVTGASSGVLSKVLGSVVYAVTRGAANFVFPLKDNAGPATMATTGVSAFVHGIVQFAVSEMGQWLPLTSLARAGIGLPHSLGADFIHAFVTAFGVIMVDVVSIYSKCLPALSPNYGKDSVFTDPESLQQRGLVARAGYRQPDSTKAMDDGLGIVPIRLSSSINSALIPAMLAHVLRQLEFDDGDLGHVMSGCLALVAFISYFPLVFGSAKRSDNAYTLQETPVP